MKTGKRGRQLRVEKHLFAFLSSFLFFSILFYLHAFHYFHDFFLTFSQQFFISNAISMYLSTIPFSHTWSVVATFEQLILACQNRSRTNKCLHKKERKRERETQSQRQSNRETVRQREKKLRKWQKNRESDRQRGN